MAKARIFIIYGILHFASAIDGPLLDPCTPLLEAASRKDWQEMSEEKNGSYLGMRCLSWLKTDHSSMQQEVPSRRIRQTGPIFPGTKWCGPGDLAKTYRDLGHLSNEDRCCRKHDMCPEQITRGQCKYGLCNSSPFTRSHCECDERFRRCLQSLKTPAADTIGALYFNIGSSTCFAESRDGTDNSVGITSESNRKDLEVWRKTRAAPSFKTVTRRRTTSECSRKHTCNYKYYSQGPYVEATQRMFSRKRFHQKRRTSRQSNYTEISTNERTHGDTEKQDPPAETISKFLYHLLRTTGVLLPKEL